MALKTPNNGIDVANREARATIAQHAAFEQAAGAFNGFATVRMRMPTMPVLDGTMHPADAYANYVRDEVRRIMDFTDGQPPSSITVELRMKHDIE